MYPCLKTEPKIDVPSPCVTCPMGSFSLTKAATFHQQTVSRATEDREAELHDGA